MYHKPASYVLALPSALELVVGQSLTFHYRREGFVEQGFLLRQLAGFVAFANSCPHWNIDLDLGDERFYDASIDRIYCRNHGATFLPTDGTCDGGPCLGKRLEQFQVVFDAQSLVVEIPEAEPV